MARARDADGKPLDIVAAKWQSKWLSQLGLSGPGANLEVSLGGPQHVDSRLLAASRILVAKSEAEVEGRSLQRLGDFTAPLSKANEGAALRMLTGVAAVALSGFGTSLEADEALLAGKPLPVPAGAGAKEGQAAAAAPAPPAPLTPEMEQSVRFRAEKKRLLSKVIQGLGNRIQQLPKEANLPATTAPASLKKGEKPTAATNKGFGGSAGSGGKAPAS